MPLVTFKGWEGAWWKRIKVGKAAVSAASWALPLKISLAAEGAKQLGLLGSLTKLGKGLIGKVGGKVAGVVPGGNIVKAAVGAGSKLAKRIGRKNLKRIAGLGGLGALGGAAALTGGKGVPAVMDPMTGQLMAGTGRRRRINPGNVKAMRRAIRRVEMGARLYHKMFSIRTGRIKGAPGVKVVKFRRKAA